MLTSKINTFWILHDPTHGPLAAQDRGLSWQCCWRSTILAAPWCSGAGVHAIWLLVLQQPDDVAGYFHSGLMFGRSADPFDLQLDDVGWDLQ